MATKDEDESNVARQSPQHLELSLFPIILILTGALLTLGPEFVYLRDLFGTRMNTIFKFYYQAWTLWALAAAFAVWLLATYAGKFFSGLTTLVAFVFVSAGLIYPVLATTTITDNWRGTVRDAENKQYATLDGMAYMQTARPADYAAINFLNERIGGRPVIVEAVGGSYTEFARVSAHTGLPTIIGWPFHEVQWRGTADTFGAREGEVKFIYQAGTYNEIKPLLDKYNVRYVYVGLMEVTTYGNAGLAKFAQAMKVIYEAQGVIIYERVEK
jgi:YYY domain-containing protein